MISTDTYVHDEVMHNTKSASLIMPFLLEQLPCTSVLDVGCGLGTWLHAAKECGITDVLGLDTPFVDKTLLGKYLGEHEFKASDLTKRFSLHRKFDLVISLEVAEHLPESSADIMVENLTRHGDCILFLLPFQVKRGKTISMNNGSPIGPARFRNQGYQCYDPVRTAFWNNEEVEVWYRQNILLYAKADLPFESAKILDVIHPQLWAKRQEKLQSLKTQHHRIKEGKVGLAFPARSFLKSLSRFGAKSI